MGKSSRDKGNRGQCAAVRLLEDRDYSVDTTLRGVATDDMIARDASGQVWSVEVKNTKVIDVQRHVRQAREQKEKRAGHYPLCRWMLLSKIHGTHAWLVHKQGEQPVIWLEKVAECSH